MIKLVSWNVNGVRAVHRKGALRSWLEKENADVVCLQEIKARVEQLPPDLAAPAGYSAAWNPASRPGYSGTATWSRLRPRAVRTGFGVGRFDEEGRIVETEFEAFTLFNIYFPNGQRAEERLRYKLDFYEAALEAFAAARSKGRPLVVCGDVNTAHRPIDLALPEDNEDVSGFLPVERAWIDRLLDAGFVDAFRRFHRDGGHYTWWDQRSRARERNLGWRIDYHFVSEDLAGRLREAFIRPEVSGSDHCPVGILLDL